MDEVLNQEVGTAFAACIAVGVFMGRLMSELALEVLTGLARLVGLWYRRKRPEAYQNDQRKEVAVVAG